MCGNESVKCLISNLSSNYFILNCNLDADCSDHKSVRFEERLNFHENQCENAKIKSFARRTPRALNGKQDVLSAYKDDGDSGEQGDDANVHR